MKVIHAFFAVVLTLAGSSLARAEHGDIVDASATFSTFVGTILTLDATTGVECHGHRGHHHCRDYYKVAAIEAAEYVAGGERGPMLNAFFTVYPDRSESDILDAIFEAAEGI